jgi:hypothetical protein
MRHYIPPKTNETDTEFWARMAKMAEVLGDDDTLHRDWCRTQSCRAPVSPQLVHSSAGVVQH